MINIITSSLPTRLCVCRRTEREIEGLPIPNMQTYIAYLIFFILVPENLENISRMTERIININLSKPKTNPLLHSKVKKI